jgi:hypothetical protein
MLTNVSVEMVENYTHQVMAKQQVISVISVVFKAKRKIVVASTRYPYTNQIQVQILYEVIADLFMYTCI